MEPPTEEELRAAEIAPAATREAHSVKPRYRPNEDDDPDAVVGPPLLDDVGQEPSGIEEGIADADKLARSGTVNEEVRNTPPAGDWNETTPD